MFPQTPLKVILVSVLARLCIRNKLRLDVKGGIEEFTITEYVVKFHSTNTICRTEIQHHTHPASMRARVRRSNGQAASQMSGERMF